MVEGLKPGIFLSLKGTRVWRQRAGLSSGLMALYEKLDSSLIGCSLYPRSESSPLPSLVPSKALLTVVRACTLFLMMSCNKKPPAIIPFRSGASLNNGSENLKCQSALGRNKNLCQAFPRYGRALGSQPWCHSWRLDGGINSITPDCPVTHHFEACRVARETFGLAQHVSADAACPKAGIWLRSCGLTGLQKQNTHFRVAFYYFLLALQGASFQKENPGVILIKFTPQGRRGG